MDPTFVSAMKNAYGFAGECLNLGAAMLEGETAADAPVRFPLAMVNRHGLVAGATGTGKTRTLQLMAGQLSAAGVPVFLADMKGDLSGLAVPGEMNPKVESRCKALGLTFQPEGCPVEFLSLTGQKGVQLRATVSSFGPILLSRVLDLNDTQQSSLAMVFKFCDDQGLLLLDLSDLREALQYLTGEGASFLKEYGGLSKATVGVLLRNIVELEQQGGDRLFGEPEFDIDDLLQIDERGRGIISIMELSDLQDRPALFSTFMMWLLAALYRELPEVGDIPKPKLVFFFDEAHHLFDGKSKAFEDQIEQVVRLIRSKGVGIFFVTQTPKDLSADVLAQLGSRVQHALRAFTPDDEKALQATARTMPKSNFYDVPATLIKLGIGEALVTLLDPKGVPTPVVATMLAPPASQMTPIPPEEVDRRIKASPLQAQYGQAVDRTSAREILQQRVEQAQAAAEQAALEEARRKAEEAAARARRSGAPAGYPSGAPRGRTARQPSAADTAAKVLRSPVARTVTRELVRGLFGVLGMRTSRRR